MASSSHHPGWLSESESDDESLSSPPLKRPASEEVVLQEETKMKPMESKKSNRKRVWSEEDELAVLKGLVDYRIKTGFEPRLDWNGFYRFVGSSIVAKFSKDQVMKKISKLKGKFVGKLEKIDQGEDLVFIKPRDAEAFGFSKMVWGTNDAEVPDNSKETLKEDEVMNQKETLKEDEVVANAKPLDEKETAKEEVAANAKPLDENEAAKKEVAANVEPLNENKGDDDDDAADELCNVRDAFDAMIPQDLSEYQKKLQLEKLMKVVSKKRKELSNEWKALCNEEIKLGIKKHKFCGKLGEAVYDS